MSNTGIIHPPHIIPHIGSPCYIPPQCYAPVASAAVTPVATLRSCYHTTPLRDNPLRDYIVLASPYLRVPVPTAHAYLCIDTRHIDICRRIDRHLKRSERLSPELTQVPMGESLRTLGTPLREAMKGTAVLADARARFPPRRHLQGLFFLPAHALTDQTPFCQAI